MLCSLHVITKPEHHLSRLNWYRDIIERVDKELYEEIIYFGINYYEWMSAFDFKKYLYEVNDLDVIAALDFIAEIDDVDFIYTILRKKLSKEEIKRHIKEAAYKGDFTKISEVQARIFSNPEGFKRRFIACLKKYYYLYFERELRFIEPLLIRKLKKESAVCENIGVKEYASKIHTRIEVTDNAFLFHKYTLFTVPFALINKIYIYISSFIDPHLLIDIDDRKSVQFTLRVNLEKTADKYHLICFLL
jgi:hypothetical protein